MPKIKHIALSTQDVEGTARFYIEVFGMKKMGTIDDPGTVGCFLSDGDINLAILNFKNDQAAGAERGRGFSGIHHIGFEVESLEAIFATSSPRPALSGATTSSRPSEWATTIARTSR